MNLLIFFIQRSREPEGRWDTRVLHREDKRSNNLDPKSDHQGNYPVRKTPLIAATLVLEPEPSIRPQRKKQGKSRRKSSKENGVRNPRKTKMENITMNKQVKAQKCALQHDADRLCANITLEDALIEATMSFQFFLKNYVKTHK